MRSSISIFSLFFLPLVVFTSCASIESRTTRNVFAFSYNDQNYQIISLTTSSGEGVNYLVLKDPSGYELLNCKDADQNGTLDQVLSGNLSLVEANNIYQSGINLAQKKGNYRERTPERTFRYLIAGYSFEIRSYLVSDRNVNNLFIVKSDSLNSESILMDTQADGKLDQFEKGSGSLSEYQSFYTDMLKAGVDGHRIEFSDGIYLVKQNPYTGADRSNSLAFVQK